jgi:hypothetical protein
MSRQLVLQRWHLRLFHLPQYLAEPFHPGCWYNNAVLAGSHFCDTHKPTQWVLLEGQAKRLPFNLKICALECGFLHPR